MKASNPQRTSSTRSYYLLNTDGGMVNDGRRKHGDPPGKAAIAVVLRDSRDRPVEGSPYGKTIGDKSNDVAEYMALIEGLRFARKNGVRGIRVYVDSEFVVEQMNGRAVPRQDDTRELRTKALKLAAEFDTFRISWIPRERNTEADGLVRSILYD